MNKGPRCVQFFKSGGGSASLVKFNDNFSVVVMIHLCRSYDSYQLSDDIVSYVNKSRRYLISQHFALISRKGCKYLFLLIYLLQSILQIIDKESRRMVSNVTRGVEKTIDRIPVINIIKRMLDRYTPLQVKICLLFFLNGILGSHLFS